MWQNRVAGRVITIRAIQPRDFGLTPSKVKKFLSSEVSRVTLRPAHALIQWVRGALGVKHPSPFQQPCTSITTVTLTSAANSRGCSFSVFFSATFLVTTLISSAEGPLILSAVNGSFKGGCRHSTRSSSSAIKCNYSNHKTEAVSFTNCNTEATNTAYGSPRSYLIWELLAKLRITCCHTTNHETSFRFGFHLSTSFFPFFALSPAWHLTLQNSPCRASTSYSLTYSPSLCTSFPVTVPLLPSVTYPS